MIKTTYEEYLAEHGELTLTNVGVSMQPMIKQGRDMFTLTKKTAERCKKYDVVLYRVPPDRYVMHRIVEVRKNDYVILGDNCMNKEYGIKDEDIIAVLTRFVRDGKEIDVRDAGYMLYAKAWYSLYPLRRAAKKAKAKIRSVIRKKEV